MELGAAVKTVLFEGEAEVAGGDALHRLGYAGTGLRLDGVFAKRTESRQRVTTLRQRLIEQAGSVSDKMQA